MRETIAAIATGMGSGIGIIRISGEEAFSVMCLRRAKRKCLKSNPILFIMEILFLIMK